MVTHTVDKHDACTALVQGHAASVAGMHSSNGWKERHLSAWKHPTQGGEIAVKRGIESFAAYADDYYNSFETELGNDGYFGEYARDMLRVINASLTMGFRSRLDSGAISRLLGDLARAAGIDPDEI